jgi:hypothetical protein
VDELIKFKDLIKLLKCLIDLFKDLIEVKLSLKVNWAKKKKTIKFKDFIKLLMGFVDSIQNLIEGKLSLKVN